MAIADKWDEVNEAFDRLERHRSLRATLTAMRKLADMIQHDLAFADARPTVSLATLMLSRGQAKHRVMVAWNEGLYDVAFVDPMMELSEPTMAHEDAVLPTLREYFDRLAET